MATKVIFITDRCSKETVVEKVIIPLLQKVIFNSTNPSVSDGNPFRAYTKMTYKVSQEKTVISLSLNLLHKNIHYVGGIEENFLKKEKIILVDIVVMDSDEARRYQANRFDEFVYLDDEPCSVARKIREIVNELARNMYHGMAMEAFVATALKSMKGNSFRGVRLGDIMLAGENQGAREKINCQCVYIAEGVHHLFGFGITSSKKNLEEQIKKNPKVYHMAVDGFSVHPIKIGEAVGLMIQAKEKGKMIHCFVKDKEIFIIPG